MKCRIPDIVVSIFCLGSAVDASAADWPMWGYDAGRTAASPDPLPSDMKLAWQRELPRQKPAWPASQFKLQFDAVYEPIVVGHRLIVGSTVDDSITAYDTGTGAELWRFFSDGPVRFATAAHNNRVYAAGDDGNLYCLDANDGKLIWKFRGGPHDRRIIGNDRLISSWPARGGLVVADGVVYFAAGIWPSMGIFVHAVDAESGMVVWTNGKTGSLFVVHPHGAPSFGSIVPQGYLAVSGDSLIVPGGRSTPAVFDRKTGELRYFHFDKRTGGYGVRAAGPFYFVGGQRYLLEDGSNTGSLDPSVIAEEWTLESGGKELSARTLAGRMTKKTEKDRRGKTTTEVKFETKELWSLEPDGKFPARVFLVAGDQIVTGDDNRVASFAVPERGDSPDEVKPLWSAEVDGEVRNMIAGDDRLFVVTESGSIACFAKHGGEGKRYRHDPQPLSKSNDEWTAAVAELTKRSGTDIGYGIVLGIGSGRLIEELLAQTQLQLIVIDDDADRVDQFRRKMQAAGLFGSRVAAHVGNGDSFAFPPYLANLVVAEQLPTKEFDEDVLHSVFDTLRPYGGQACFMLNDAHGKFEQAVRQAKLANGRIDRAGQWTALVREGALPGAADWTHQYADASNSVVSNDDLVKAPLGVLWFGGPSHDKVLPRHGHGPAPQVAGGRLFIEGPDMLRAVDVYTGRLLWEKDLPNLGAYYDNTSHFPGAGEIGSNYVSLADKVYVVYGRELLEVDAATGKTERTFQNEDGHHWGYAAVWQDRLVATSGPVKVSDKGAGGAPLQELLEPTQYSSASRKIVVFDREGGKRLWSRDAQYNFRHNGIAVAANKLFCIDALSPDKLQALKRRGVDLSKQAQLLALDLDTGKKVWSTEQDVFGTFLNYSAEHDVLLQAGSAYRDRAKDEVDTGMVAYRGGDGEVLWKDLALKHNGPCMLWRDKIITNGGGGFQLELLTGQKTGWTFSRMYGCNTAVGSKHLLTFRSGAAGFCDLTGNSGTGNLGGFRSSCTANLIAADGVLSAPDYTRTCSCAYQNQSSLAFIHMPDAELWTFNDDPVDDPAERIGVNFGAPGDRRDANGTLWLEFPNVGGPSPDLRVKLDPEQPRWFQRHPSQVSGDALNWVTASGAEGLESVRLTVRKDARDERSYTVRFYFSEPDDLASGERVFDVALQGQTVLSRFDAAREAGGTQRGVVKEFRGVKIKDDLQMTLSSQSKAAPLLCGVEVVAESN